MVNEVITSPLPQQDPESIPSLQGFGPIKGNPPRELMDEAGRPLLPAIARALKEGVHFPAPAMPVETRERSVLDAGARYPAVDHELLAQYEERGRKLQAVATGELLGKGVLAIGQGLRRIADAVRFPAPVPAVQTHPRSAVDAGAAFPAVDHYLLAQYEERGRQLHAEVTGELLGKGLLAIGRGLWSAVVWIFAPAPKHVNIRDVAPYGKFGVLDVPPDYEARRAQFYGRGL